MRNTQSKGVRRMAEKYVLDTISDRMEDGWGDKEHPCTWYMDVMRTELASASVDFYINGRREHKDNRDGVYNGSPYWLWYIGCANGEHGEVYYGAIYDLLKEWLDQTEEEQERYGADDAEHLYRHLTAQAFDRLYRNEQKEVM